VPFTLPRFYPIFDLAVRPERPLRETVLPLVEAGVRIIQLRAKQIGTREFFEKAAELIALVSTDVSVIINDRADVAQLAGAAGVHVGQDDLPPAVVRKLLGDNTIVGYSTHTAEQVRAADKEPVDYIAFGPVFSTSTKKDTESMVGLDGLRAVRGLTSKPLVAIGGIAIENASQVIENKADSVAAINAWQDTGDILKQLREFASVLGRFD
jgi:thiamine-phosphate pyrophosphorylase